VDRSMFTLARRGDSRFTDEQIFAILRGAEEDEVNAAELCHATGITIPMYCVWKARYGRLTLPELCDLRRQEERRARTLRGLLFTSMLLLAGAVVLFIIPGEAEPTSPGEPARAVQPGAAEGDFVPTSAGAPEDPTMPPDTEPTAAARHAGTSSQVAGQGREVASDPSGATTAVGASPPAAPLTPVTGDAYAVQVAAMPDVRQAQRAVERLAAAGHPAYVLPGSVDSVEVYRVRVGPFASRQAAEEIAARLEREGYKGPWIAR
jgi:hypothetical protein